MTPSWRLGTALDWTTGVFLLSFYYHCYCYFFYHGLAFGIWGFDICVTTSTATPASAVMSLSEYGTYYKGRSWSF